MRILSLLFVMFALIGCSGITIGGNEDKLTSACLKQHPTVGRTARAKVRQCSGTSDSGHVTVMVSGRESWYYLVDKRINLVGLVGSMILVTEASQAADAIDKSSQKDSNLLMILFNEKGAVKNWMH